MLDVSDLLLDADMVEQITIIRQAETVTNKGRVSAEQKTLYAFANVQPKDTLVGGNEITREAGMEYRGAQIVVHTTFRLRSASINYQPDKVIWNGDPYLVTLVNNFSHYGAGFVQAECTAIEAMDAPPL